MRVKTQFQLCLPLFALVLTVSSVSLVLAAHNTVPAKFTFFDSPHDKGGSVSMKGVNNQGQILGNLYYNRAYGFVINWKSIKTSEVPITTQTPGILHAPTALRYIEPSGINNLGQIVGTYTDANYHKYMNQNKLNYPRWRLLRNYSELRTFNDADGLT